MHSREISQFCSPRRSGIAQLPRTSPWAENPGLRRDSEDMDVAVGERQPNRVDEPGAYRSSRAAALSGVPERTVHDWASKGIVVPTVSAQRVKLWSYADLMSLRVVAWLRSPVKRLRGSTVPASSMPKVKKALETLAGYGLDIWSAESGTRVLVDASGRVIVRGRSSLAGDQVVDERLLDLLAPFERFEGSRGPDLRQPRPHLRIIPGKLSGEPHVQDTRLESRAIAALVRRGFELEYVAELYPFASPEALAECVSLEDQLSANVTKAAA